MGNVCDSTVVTAAQATGRHHHPWKWLRSATEQARQHRCATTVPGVRWTVAALALWHAGQHLIDVLTTSGVARLTAGAAGGRTAHGFGPSGKLTIGVRRSQLAACALGYDPCGAGSVESECSGYPLGYQEYCADVGPAVHSAREQCLLRWFSSRCRLPCDGGRLRAATGSVTRRLGPAQGASPTVRSSRKGQEQLLHHLGVE